MPTPPSDKDKNPPMKPPMKKFVFPKKAQGTVVPGKIPQQPLETKEPKETKERDLTPKAAISGKITQPLREAKEEDPTPKLGNIRVTILQWFPENVEDILKFLEENISDKTTDIVLFPESFIPNLSGFAGKATEEFDRRSIINKLRELNVAGIITGRDFYSDDEKPANAAWYVSKGEIIHTYHKQNLTPGERNTSVGPESSGFFFAPCPCADHQNCTHSIPMGIMICADLEDKAIVRNLIDNEPKPQVIFGPAFCHAGYDVTRQLNKEDQNYKEIKAAEESSMNSYVKNMLTASKDAFVVRADWPSSFGGGGSGMVLKKGGITQEELEERHIVNPDRKILRDKVLEAPEFPFDTWIKTVSIPIVCAPKPKEVLEAEAKGERDILRFTSTRKKEIPPEEHPIVKEAQTFSTPESKKTKEFEAFKEKLGLSKNDKILQVTDSNMQIEVNGKKSWRNWKDIVKLFEENLQKPKHKM